MDQNELNGLRNIRYSEISRNTILSPMSMYVRDFVGKGLLTQREVEDIIDRMIQMTPEYGLTPQQLTAKILRQLFINAYWDIDDVIVDGNELPKQAARDIVETELQRILQLAQMDLSTRELNTWINDIFFNALRPEEFVYAPKKSS